MNSAKRILFPIPEDERSPLVDCLLQFIDWQRGRIEHLEKELEKLKKQQTDNVDTVETIGTAGTTHSTRMADSRPEREKPEQRKPQNSQFDQADQADTDAETAHHSRMADSRSEQKKLIEKKKRVQKKKIDILNINEDGFVTPENIQQLLVKNIQQQLVNMEHKNRRRFTRIPIDWNADLDFGVKKYYQHPLKDISLSGVFVTGSFKQKKGDICSIMLTQSRVDSDLTIRAACSIVRINGHGMALDFISMKIDDFIHLQTVLLHEANDPIILGTEFVNNIDLEFEDDLILCKSYKFDNDKKKKK
ncbi:MAG: PilZ domain-containing protein [Candidatus Electrothrix sp. YB6]